MSFWKILRVLSTDRCNYRCLYCHNEGQSIERKGKMLSYENFIKVMNAIKNTGIREIRFSGGEPLINPDTIRMIEWADENTDYEIGLATNASLITESVAKCLSETRVLVTVHLPAIDDGGYKRVTGNKVQDFQKAIKLLDKYGVKYSFNFVLYPETIENINSVLNYVISSEKRVKLLPYIEKGFNNYSSDVIENISKKLDQLVKKKEYLEQEGITIWEYENGAKIKMIDSPCYTHDMNKCREYGELRLLPDMHIQDCIFNVDNLFIGVMSENEIKEELTKLWKKFEECKGIEKI